MRCITFYNQILKISVIRHLNNNIIVVKTLPIGIYFTSTETPSLIFLKHSHKLNQQKSKVKLSSQKLYIQTSSPSSLQLHTFVSHTASSKMDARSNFIRSTTGFEKYIIICNKNCSIFVFTDKLKRQLNVTDKDKQVYIRVGFDAKFNSKMTGL